MAEQFFFEFRTPKSNPELCPQTLTPNSFDWEAEAEREEALAAREAAVREEATATPDGRAADGQSKIFDPGGCVPLVMAGGEAVAVHPQRRLEEPQAEEEEEEVEQVSNCQPIGLYSSAVCGGESE